MIPWFVVRMLAFVVRPFGRQVLSAGTVGRFGADRFYIVRPGDFADARLLADVTSTTHQ